MHPQDKRKKQCAQLLLPGLLLLCFGIWQGLNWLYPTSVSADNPTEITLPEDTPSTDSKKLIALTFDDGPHPVTTPRLLDGLSQRGVHATFFLIGKQISDNAELVQTMDLMGHQIGLHTYDHVQLAGLSSSQIMRQLEDNKQVLQTLLGRSDFWVRPPYGITDSTVENCVNAPLIIWSVDPEDWRDQNADRVVEHVVSHAEDGAIILMHDIFPESVDAALRIVDELKAQGYEFVTVEEMFLARGITPKAGERYSSAPPAA